MDGDPVFRALADPSRRLLLDRLFDRDGRTLAELQSQLDMTRFGVMKHLRVLEEAGLVTTRKVGREKLHYLNPVPIRLIHDRWIGKYTAVRAGALTDLKAQLEEGHVMSVKALARPQQVYHIFIKASPERVWEGITSPAFTCRYFYGTRLESNLNPGSPFVYRRADGSAVIVAGEVLESDPPRRLVHTWRALFNPELVAEAPSRVTWQIEPREGGLCLLTVVHDRLEGAPKTAEEVSGQGWMMVLSGLKTLLETGQPLAGG